MEEEDFKPKKKKGFFPRLSVSFWLKIFILLAVFIAGLAVQHYYIEPAISTTFSEQLNSCFSEKQLLNKETNNCLVELENCKKDCRNDTNS